MADFFLPPKKFRLKTVDKNCKLHFMKTFIIQRLILNKIQLNHFY